ncbi:hypothetical protein KCP73_01435 [Salmonella enterica subsp. enterica]|nr:hypothetical protein KCP73_01435 [Salmonella enterica subsp. enterica]
MRSLRKRSTAARRRSVAGVEVSDGRGTASGGADGDAGWWLREGELRRNAW